jgi:hypothetical protein
VKNYSSYTPENTVKNVKKVCRDVIGVLKICLINVKNVKILNMRFLTGILTDFYQRVFNMQSKIFNILTNLTQKTHTKKSILIQAGLCRGSRCSVMRTAPEIGGK